MSKKYLQKAVEIIGGQTALAKAIGVKQAHVWNWLNRDNELPAKYAKKIETATNKQITKEQLCPEIFN